MCADADPTRIAQIVGNLLHNAAKFTPAAARSASSSPQDGRRSIRVRRLGRGIPPEQLERVFDMFAQSTAGDAASGGLGIGLALARRLAELHGGALAAASAGEGHGRQRSR